MTSARTRKSHLPVALLLLGMVGLFTSGVGALPGVPGWAWLAVLALGAGLPLASRRASTRRFDRAELRRSARARRNLRIARRSMVREAARTVARLAALDKRLDTILTPEQAAQLVEQHNAMAADLEAVKSEVVLLKQERNARRFGTVLGGEENG